MSRLSVVLITKNEERNLARALESVAWADEILVVDSHSEDKTAEIARRFGARVIETDWPGFGIAKQRAVDCANGEWVLSLDADEVVTPELAREIRSTIDGNGTTAGYVVPRRTNFLGRWIYHCGWYPDPVLRLFRKSHGRFDEAPVHEKVILDGPTGRLQGELLHYSYPSLELYLEKMNRYTTLGAEEAFRQGKRAGVSDIALRPLVAFVKHYVSKRGFQDGLEGFVLSVLSAISVMVKYAKLRHLQRTADGKVDHECSKK